MADVIGAVQVDITGNYAPLQAAFTAAVNAAKQAANDIASAFGTATQSMATTTQAAVNMSQGLGVGAQAFTNAAAAAQQAQGAFQAAAQAAQATAGTATGMASAGVSANQFAAAMDRLVSVIQQESAAATLASQRNMELSASFSAAASGANSVGTGAAGARGNIAALYLAVRLLKDAFQEVEGIREEEMSLKRLSETSGISAQKLKEFELAVNRAGGEGAKFSQAINKVEKDIGAVQRGTAKMTDEFVRLGVNIHGDAIDAILQMSQAYHDARNPGEALEAMTTALGMRQEELVSVLRKGPQYIREQMAAASGLAAEYAKATAAAAELTRAENEWKEQTDVLRLQVLPGITYALKAFIQAMGLARLGFQSMMDGMGADIENFKAKATALVQTAQTLRALPGPEGVATVGQIWSRVAGEEAARYAGAITNAKKHVKEYEDLFARLWGPQKQPSPGAGNDFPAAKGKSKEALEEYQKAQELLKELKANAAAPGSFSAEELKGLGATDEEVKSYQDTIQNDIRFWGDRTSNWKTKGEAFKDDVRKGTTETAALIKKESEQFASDMKKNLTEGLKEAMSGAETPASAGLDFINQFLSTGNKPPEVLVAAMEERNKLLKEAGKESESIIREFVKNDELAFAAEGPHTLEATRAWITEYITNLQRVGGAEKEIAEQRKKLAEVGGRIGEQGAKIAGLQEVAAMQQKETYITQQKITLQSDYDSLIHKSYRDEINFLHQMQDLETQGLKVKEESAFQEFAIAEFSGDKVKAEEAYNKWLATNNALQVQGAQQAAQVAKLKQEQSLSTQIGRGINKDIEQFGQNAASSFGNALITSGKIGTAFKQALQQFESGAIATVLGAAFKKAIETSGIEKIFDKIFGVKADPQKQQEIAALHADTIAVRAETAATRSLTQAIQQLTAAVQGNNTALPANTAATTQDTQAVQSTVAGELANTAALASNTIATWANTAVMAFSGILSLLTGGVGGGGGGGESVTSSIGFGGEAAADGGHFGAGLPIKVGERGEELFIPDTPGTIIPADKTKGILSQISGLAGRSFGVPGVPATAFAGTGGYSPAATAGGPGGDSFVTNQNTGLVGNQHFNIYGANNPRQVAREVAQYLKLTFPNGSPQNRQR